MKGEYLNSQIETMSPEELRKIQEEKFLKQLDTYGSDRPFTRENSKNTGLREEI